MQLHTEDCTLLIASDDCQPSSTQQTCSDEEREERDVVSSLSSHCAQADTAQYQALNLYQLFV